MFFIEKIKLVVDVDDVILKTVDAIIEIYNVVAKEEGIKVLSTNKNERFEGKSWIEIIFEEYGTLKNFNNLFCKEIHKDIDVNQNIVNFIKEVSKEVEVFLFTKPHSIKELS